eukprot:17180-Heterococcus_DN1.PRE.3
MHQKFVRRVDGKTAARAVFAASLPLRKTGVLGFEVYLAHAAIELHVNKEPEVAQRILEYGLSKHASFITEPDYILAYIDALLLKGDESNLRVLLERILGTQALPPERAMRVWDKFVELELWRNTTGGSLSKAEAVEARRNELFPTENKYSGLCNIWQRYAEALTHVKLTIYCSQCKAAILYCAA